MKRLTLYTIISLSGGGLIHVDPVKAVYDGKL